MMMRMRVILAGVLICLVLVCGCGQKAQDGDAAPAQTIGPVEGADEQATQGIGGDAEPPVIEGVSQEDIDALGRDLEGLEFEDLGGLTDT
jgi:hypothetical protein